MTKVLNKKNSVIIPLFHIGFVAAMFCFSFKHLLLTLTMIFIAGSLGVGIGYHRLLTHRGFKVSLWLEYFFTFCALFSLEGGPLFWVGVHRLHHPQADKPGLDPHTPLDGLYWSHMGWLQYLDKKYRSPEFLKKWAPDLLADRVHCLLSKYHFVPTVVLGLSLLAFAGIPAMLWGIFVPVVIGWHATWLVNSATHMWGYRRYNTPDNSRNNFWIALITWGEGNHNNHHKFAKSARHSKVWWEPDTNWYLIWLMWKLGIAEEVIVQS